MSEVIENIPGVRNISDDIIVYTKGKDHLDNSTMSLSVGKSVFLLSLN